MWKFEVTEKQRIFAVEYAAKGFNPTQWDFTKANDPEAIARSVVCECIICDQLGRPYPVHDLYRRPGHDIVIGAFRADIKEMDYERVDPSPQYWSDFAAYQRFNRSHILVFAGYNIEADRVTFTGWVPKVRMLTAGKFLRKGETNPKENGEPFVAKIDMYMMRCQDTYDMDLLIPFCASHGPSDILRWEAEHGNVLAEL